MRQHILVLFLIIGSFSYGQEMPPPPPPVIQNTPSSYKEGRVVDFPDIEAQFKGGNEELKRYISKNINYPQEAVNQNIQGKVYLSFIVKKNGNVKNIEVNQGAHPLLKSEAIRLLKGMSKWIPAKKNEKKVNSRCRLPINFILD